MSRRDTGGARAQLSALVDGSDDAIIVTSLDGIVTEWSRGAVDLYGYAAQEIVGEHISRVYPDDQVAMVEAILGRIRNGEPNQVTEGTRRRADGTLVEVEVRVSPIFDSEGSVVGASSIARDISRRRRNEQELRESRQFLEHTQAIGHIGSWKTQVGPEAIFTWTPETYRIFGIEQGTVVRNVDLFNLVEPEDRMRLVATMLAVRSDGQRATLELRITRPDGSRRWVFLAADAQYDANGVAVGMIGFVQDITERKQAELQLAHDALYDELTDLPNRTLYLERISRALLRAERDGSRVAVLCLDLDRFNLFSDTHGAEQADAVLRAMADRLAAALPPTDTVARCGPNEFGLVCESIATASDAADRAARVRAAIEEPFAFSAGEALVTASIGIALSAPDASAEVLVRNADIAMHRARDNGRNRFELYDVQLRQEVERRYLLETGLHRALDNDELYVAYQPVASMREGRFVGAEALLRWRSPQGRTIMPSEFIPVAEDTGLIIPIGAWVLETACRQLRDWRERGAGPADWYVSVNVAAAQLRAPDFLEVVARALEHSGVDGASLRIELTETTLLDDRVAIDVLREIRALGVRISIDDFGTRYSSLSYLTRLPIDELKIDQAFVQALAGDAPNQAVVAAIVAIGRALDLSVTAEGVESGAQLDMLRELGCESVQGFYFAPAVPPGECLTVLQRPLERGATAGWPVTPTIRTEHA